MSHINESTHFYHRTGNPCYTVTGKNGQERATTLRDARTMNLVPSVTTIIKESAKFGLEKWKQEQVLLAVLTLPKIDGESEQEYIDRIIADSQEQSKQAAERGKQIHAWIQQGFEGAKLGGEARQYFNVACQEIVDKCGLYDWRCEKPFATERYGGKSDLYTVVPLKPVLLDIKTKEELTDKTTTIYDEHTMQLAAYREGLLLPDAQCGILFVATKKVEAKLVRIPEDKLQRGMNMFNALLNYWYAKTGL